MSVYRLILVSTLAFALGGCTDEPGPVVDGGTDAQMDGTIEAGCEIPAPADAPRFDSISELPRFVVSGTDFSSSYYGWLNADGFAIDGDWINSGTTAPGLVATLSGDTTWPTQLPRDGTFYVIDRYGTDVVTRVTIPQGVVLGQFRTHGDSCDSAFSSNPSDAVIVSPTQGFVTRYSYDETGAAPPECRGSDLLEFNPTTMTRTGNTIDLSSFAVDVQVRPAGGGALVTRRVQPRPTRGFLTSTGHVVVTLERLSGDFNGSASGVLVVVDPATGTFEGHEVPGLKNCGRITPVPGSPNRIAMLCTGFKKNDAMDASEPSKRDSSGIVIFEIAADGGITEVAAWRAIEHPTDPALTGDMVMLDTTHALVIKRGNWQSTTVKDDLYLLEFTTGVYTLVVSSEMGYGFYGSMSYDPTTRLVLIPDVDAGVRRYRVNETLTVVTVLETITGLGPAGIPVAGTGLVDIGTPTCD